MPFNPKSLKNLKPSKKGMTNNPNGQPRKTVWLVNKVLQDEGYEPASKRDIEQNYMQMIQLPMQKIIELAKDQEQPILIRTIAKNLVSWKWFDIIERMLDRGIWKAIQKTEVEATVKDYTFTSNLEENAKT